MTDKLDTNIFPEIHLFPVLDKIAKIGRFVTDRLYADSPNTGGANFLDEQLNETQLPYQPELWS